MACFGGPTDAKTPNLDRLAGEGMKLTGFYSPAAVCSPTRQALLTGMYPVRNGAYPNHSHVKAGTLSMPYHLRPLGYPHGVRRQDPFRAGGQLPVRQDDPYDRRGKRGARATRAAMANWPCPAIEEVHHGGQESSVLRVRRHARAPRPVDQGRPLRLRSGRS